MTYRFRAARDDGGIVAGYLETRDTSEAAALLAERGLHPLAIEPARPAEGHRQAASRPDLAVFMRALASLTAAGVPLDQALAVAESLVTGPLEKTAVEARRLLRSGRGLADALAGGRGVIPPVVLGMIRAGEARSRLAEALEGAADQLEREAELLGRIRQALAYPAVVAVAGTISVIVIGVVVVPRFAAMLVDYGQELPAASRWLLAGSEILTGHGFWMLGAMVLGLVAAKAWSSRPGARLRIHAWLLGLPLIGVLRHLLAAARFSRALGGSLRAGVPLHSAIESARGAAGDEELERRVGRARDRVAQGQTITSAFAKEQVLPATLLPFVTVGEAGASLGAMLLRIADLASLEAERRLRTLVGLLEPALVVTFGGLVAFVSAALLQAVYSLRPGGP